MGVQMDRPDHEQKARDAWGEALPDWVLGIAFECNKSSQSKVAKQLGVSVTQVSQVVGNKYGGSLVGIETAYRGFFGSESVLCPVLGKLAVDKCQSWSKRAPTLKSNNRLNTLIRRACENCAHNKFKSEE